MDERASERSTANKEEIMNKPIYERGGVAFYMGDRVLLKGGRGKLWPGTVMGIGDFSDEIPDTLSIWDDRFGRTFTSSVRSSEGYQILHYDEDLRPFARLRRYLRHVVLDDYNEAPEKWYVVVDNTITGTVRFVFWVIFDGLCYFVGFLLGIIQLITGHRFFDE